MLCEINDVVFQELKRHEDKRGWLVELFRHDEIDKVNYPVMSYVSMTHPGVARGPHEHENQTDIFCFLGPSTFRLYLWDNRKGSATYGQHASFEAGNAPVALLASDREALFSEVQADLQTLLRHSTLNTTPNLRLRQRGSLMGSMDNEIRILEAVLVALRDRQVSLANVRVYLAHELAHLELGHDRKGAQIVNNSRLDKEAKSQALKNHELKSVVS